MMVLNALAAKYLRHIGCNCVTLSVEADRRQLEEAAAVCPVPLSLVVFGRPPLLQTRVEAPAMARPGTVLEDARGVRMCPRREGSVTVFRPVEPYSLCDLRNPALRVAHLVADLNAAPDPLAAWRSLARPLSAPLRFNYERTLR